MAQIRVTIDIDSRDIPELVCGQRLDEPRLAEHLAGVADALANDLGLHGYLSRPDRIEELRRALWEAAPWSLESQLELSQINGST
jgi:hypothetical protein